MIFIKTSNKMFQIMSWADHYWKKRARKLLVSGKKSKKCQKIMKIFVGLRTKTYSYLSDGGGENKKAKHAKKLS